MNNTLKSIVSTLQFSFRFRNCSVPFFPDPLVITILLWPQSPLRVSRISIFNSARLPTWTGYHLTVMWIYICLLFRESEEYFSRFWKRKWKKKHFFQVHSCPFEIKGSVFFFFTIISLHVNQKSFDDFQWDIARRWQYHVISLNQYYQL